LLNSFKSLNQNNIRNEEEGIGEQAVDDIEAYEKDQKDGKEMNKDAFF
jgi:hypothetical protein